MAIKIGRQAMVEERDRKIEEMDIEELKKYLCMKNYQKPEKCFDCPGINTCKAGQRAVVLLDAKQREEVEESKSTYNDARKERIREKFLEVLSKDNMTDFLVESEGLTRASARAKMIYWKNQFPEIASEHGFAEKFAAERRQQSETEYNKGLRQEGIERYKEAMAHDDPIKFVMSKYGIDRGQSIAKLSGWRNRYKDIDIHMEEQQVDNNDEVSVEDFLKEVESHAGITSEEKQPDEETASEQKGERINACGIPAVLVDKANEIGRAMDKIKQQIDTMKQRYDELKKAQDAVMLTMEIMKQNY